MSIKDQVYVTELEDTILYLLYPIYLKVKPSLSYKDGELDLGIIQKIKQRRKPIAALLRSK